VTATMWIAGIVSIGLALLAGWALPALGMRALMPTLERSALKVTNYRGREVTVGLGIVWAMWAVGVMVAGNIASGAIGLFAGAATADGAVVAALNRTPWSMAILVLPIGLVLVAAFLGLVDDMYGSHGVRGFKGHWSALRAGELTTGGMKLLGIGLAAAGFAVGPALVQGELSLGHVGYAGPSDTVAIIAGWVLGTLVIALAANLVNLLDLRPGRALKGYSLLAAVGVVGLVFRIARLTAVERAFAGNGGPGAISLVPGPSAPLAALAAITLAILLLGPVFAVWRYDLGERGMLGDAGANAAGALAGYVLAATLPLWGLAVAAAVSLALNLASEKVSFSEIIERVGFLRWLDGLGRVRDGVDVAAGADVGGADRHGGSAGTDGTRESAETGGTDGEAR
jgi:hypothetical protein